MNIIKWTIDNCFAKFQTKFLSRSSTLSEKLREFKQYLIKSMQTKSSLKNQKKKTNKQTNKQTGFYF